MVTLRSTYYIRFRANSCSPESSITVLIWILHVQTLNFWINFDGACHRNPGFCVKFQKLVFHHPCTFFHKLLHHVHEYKTICSLVRWNKWIRIKTYGSNGAPYNKNGNLRIRLHRTAYVFAFGTASDFEKKKKLNRNKDVKCFSNCEVKYNIDFKTSVLVTFYGFKSRS